MSELWTPVGRELAEKAAMIASTPLDYVERLERAVLDDLDPLMARAEFDALSGEVVSGWAYVSQPQAAQIYYGLPSSWGEGGVLSAEVRLKNDVSLHLAGSENGLLRLIAFGTSLSNLHSGQTQSWRALDGLSGMLRETRKFLQVRATGTIRYGVYWQLAKDFGLRERLAVFEGMSAGGV